MSQNHDYIGIINRHKETLVELEDMLSTLGYAQIMAENEGLVHQQKQQQALLETQQKSLQDLQETLEQATFLLSEKNKQIEELKALSVVNLAQEQKRLIKNIETKQIQALLALQAELQGYIDLYQEKAALLAPQLNEAYRKELSEIRGRLKAHVEAAQAHVVQGAKEAQAHVQEAHETAIERRQRAVPVNDAPQGSEPKAKTVRPNADGKKGLEMKWGLNVINKIGIVLILGAVVLAGQYAYNNYFGEVAKSIAFYALGLCFTVLGYFLSKRDYKSLAMALIGGGIGILYTATFVSAFYLKILPLMLALAIAATTAGLSIYLAWQQRSQVLAILALAGGYLPVLAYVVVEGIDNLPIAGAIFYIFLLNAVMLVLAGRMHWRGVIIQSFIFDAFCINALALLLPSSVVALAVVALNFGIYFVLVVGGQLSPRPHVNKAERQEKLQKLQNWRLDLTSAVFTLNAMVHVFSAYSMLEHFVLIQWAGTMALVYGLVHFAVWYGIKHKWPWFAYSSTTGLVDLSFILGCGLGALAVPLQFSQQIQLWFYGWLIEGTVLCAYSLRQNYKPAQFWGATLLLFTTIDLIIQNPFLFDRFRTFNPDIDFKSFALVLSTIGLAWLYTKEANDKSFTEVENLSVSVTINRGLIIAALIWPASVIAHQIVLLATAVLGSFTSVETVFVYAMVLVGLGKISNGLHLERYIPLNVLMHLGRGLMVLFVLLACASYDNTDGIRFALEVVLLVAIHSFGAFSLNTLLKQIFRVENLQVRALVIALTLLVLYIQNFILRVDSTYANVIFNLSLIAFALVYITWGYIRSIDSLRKTGLAVALIATVKLLLVDSIDLPLAQKIISYFAFGLALLGISFVYQKLENKIKR